MLNYIALYLLIIEKRFSCIHVIKAIRLAGNYVNIVSEFELINELINGIIFKMSNVMFLAAYNECFRVKNYVNKDFLCYIFLRTFLVLVNDKFMK